MISYTEAYFRDPTSYMAPGTLDRRIKLEEGKIGCLSCHAPSSSENKMLLMPGPRGLCVNCHRM
jgi:predicted CXXCH cytochrome family protein